MSNVSFQEILDKAIADYHTQIGVQLEKHPLANELRGRDSPDEVLKLLEDKAKAFKVYRDGNHKLITWLSPVVQAIHLLSGVLGEAVSLRSDFLVDLVDLFAICLPGAYKPGKGNLCRRGSSNHGVYPGIFRLRIS